MDDLESWALRQRCQYAIVGILVDDEHAKATVRLSVEGTQKDAQTVRAVDGRDDEVERGEVWTLHRT